MGCCWLERSAASRGLGWLAHREHVDVVLSAALLRREDALARGSIFAHVGRVSEDSEQTYHLTKAQDNGTRLVHNAVV